ncbi:MAG: urocanate reductase [Nocardioidaceae bacterium]|nr:urocanate reductase [Nocardioidaceae bacterium]
MSDFDVVVVGSGFAGLAAAITARSEGATVLLLDGAPELGGSSRLSGGKVMGAGSRLQRRHGVEDDPEDLYHFYMALNRYLLEPSVIWALAEESGSTVDWLEDIGVQFDPRLMPSGEERTARMHITVGEGHAVIATLVRYARSIGVEIAVGMQVDRLLVEHAEVVGVAVGDDTLRTDSVILATGGFGANRDLVERYLPRVAADDWAWYIGAETSSGSAFALAEQVSADVVGHGRAARLITPNFGNVLEGGYLPGWLLVVNAEGRRFYDETSSYSITGPIVDQQPAPVYAVFDEAAKEASTPHTVETTKKVSVGRRDGRAQKWVKQMLDEQVERGTVLRAQSLEELAEAMGVPSGQLIATVRQYNADCAVGVDHRFRKRSDVLRPVTAAPYYATELRLSHVALTAVGLRIDSGARVIDQLGRPVLGLYAAGECTGGVVGETYVGSGNSITNAFVYGRIAGRSAAKRGTS